jgi:hypothetical protein
MTDFEHHVATTGKFQVKKKTEIKANKEIMRSFEVFSSRGRMSTKTS